MKSLRHLTGLLLLLIGQTLTAQSLYNGFNGGMVHVTGRDGVHLYSIATDADGSCFFTGYDNADPIENQSDILVGKLLPDGSYDAAFGDEGKVYINTGTGNYEGAFDIAVQPDGKLLISHYVNANASIHYNVMRLLPDGSLDTTFNGTGFGEVPESNILNLQDACPLTLLENGKILTMYHSLDTDLGVQLEVVQRNADGTIDTEFGESGIQRINFIALSRVDEAGDIAVLENGNIAISGTDNFIQDFIPQSDMGVAMLSSNGGFDLSFSENGLATYNIGTDNRFDKAHGMIATEDGGVLVLGEVKIPGLSGHLVALLKLHPDGSINTSFGNNGLLELDASLILIGSTAALSGLTLPGGDLLILASDEEPAAGDFSLIKMDQNGVLDTSFGEGGFYNFGGDTVPVRALGIAASPDFNYIYTVGSGYGNDPTGYVFCVGINNGASGVNDSNPEKKLSMYPNPASDIIQFYSASANETYTLTDLSGKLKMNGKTKIGNNFIPLTSLENGFYFIRAGGKSGKFMVVR